MEKVGSVGSERKSTYRMSYSALVRKSFEVEVSAATAMTEAIRGIPSAVRSEVSTTRLFQLCDIIRVARHQLSKSERGGGSEGGLAAELIRRVVAIEDYRAGMLLERMI